MISPKECLALLIYSVATSTFLYVAFVAWGWPFWLMPATACGSGVVTMILLMVREVRRERDREYAAGKLGRESGPARAGG